MAAQDEVTRADIFLKEIAGQIETFRREIFDFSDEAGYYALATDWLEAMSMVDALEESQAFLTPTQRERFNQLLKELEEVRPVAEEILTRYQKA